MVLSSALLCFLSLSLVLLSSNAQIQIPSRSKIDDILPQISKQQLNTATNFLEDGLEDFTQAMYLYMVQHTDSPNFVFSPLSIHSSLAMLYLGTTKGSETEDELATAMGVINSSPFIKLGYKNVVETYSKEQNFLYGNNFWVQEGFRVKPQFKKTVKDNMNSDVEVIDFGNRNSVDIVNSWVSRMTGGKITDIVKEFSFGTSLFIANALYFKEKWSSPFDNKHVLTGDILEEDFQTLNSGLRRVPVMEQVSNILGYETIRFNNVGAEIVTIPYKNELFEMQLILPWTIRDLQILEDLMLQNKMRDLTRKSDKFFNIFSDRNRTLPDEYIEDYYLRMPTFKIRTELDAVDPLKSLGAKRVTFSAVPLD